MRVKRKRPYLKGARAESEAETRNRIIEATVALHEELGPRQTTIKGIAERAGVQRLTVYRHFPNQHELIAACSARWSELQSPPPTVPAKVSRDEVRDLLVELYRYYRNGESMLTKVLADAPFMPEVREAVAPFDDYLNALAAALARAWRGNSARRRLTLRHAIEFATWRSLASLSGSDRAAAELVISWCDAAS